MFEKYSFNGHELVLQIELLILVGFLLRSDSKEIHIGANFVHLLQHGKIQFRNLPVDMQKVCGGKSK